MGADIHGVLQEHGYGNKWRTLMEIEDGRNYWLFSALADVRNYSDITPVCEPRGLPDDLEIVDGDSVKLDYSWCRAEGEKSHFQQIWLGEHSHTWFTVKELLEWSGWDQVVHGSGVISRETYDEWDKISSPYPRSSYVGGGGVIMHPEPGWTHIRVEWDEPLRPNCETFLAFLKYADLRTYGEARIVIGFDS